MKGKFHKNIAVAALREVDLDAESITCIYPFAVHADLNRGYIYPHVKEKKLDEKYKSYKGLKLDYQDYTNLTLNNHHVNRINSNRILTLIKYSKESFNEYKLVKDGIFHYCNALHFLCDSAIPSTISESMRKKLEEQYLTSILDIKWDNDKNKIFSYQQIENMILNFIKRISGVHPQNDTTS